jgi:hypothetical protein
MAASMIPETFPRQQYYCVLDEQPDFLVPTPVLASYAGLENITPLIVNPRCWFGWHGSLPPALAAAAYWHDNIYDFPWTVWVDDPDRNALWPYWLGPRYAGLLHNMAPGELYDGTLPEDVVRNLTVAQILVSPHAADRAHHAWNAIIGATAPSFDRGWLELSGLLPPFHLGALRRYYRYHTRMGSFAFGDAQTPGRFIAYDEPVTKYVHHQLARTISDIAQRRVVPSYNYLAFYQGGATLDPHTDREACEYTVSLCIDATPDPHTHGAWPLQLQTPEGSVSVTLGIGDALLFRGRILTHWRDQLAAGYTSSSILFHFVDG